MADTDVSNGDAYQDRLIEEASTWFARMRGPDSASHRQALDAWLNQSPAHLGAYNHASEIFAMGKLLPASSRKGAPSETGRGGRRGRSVAVVFASLAAVIFIAWIGRPILSSSNYLVGRAGTATAVPTRYVSTTKRQTFQLTDGSFVTLNPGSLLMTAFDASKRDLELQSGSARFDVVHEARPFIVRAGGGSVTARGTIFEVAVTSSHGLAVRLVRGAVDVERPSLTSMTDTQPVMKLTPGESVIIGDVATPAAVASLDSLSTVSIRPSEESAAKEYDSASLASIIAEANSSADVPIRLADPAIGNLKVSGRFRTDDTNQLATRLAALFSLQVDRSHPEEIILRMP